MLNTHNVAPIVVVLLDAVVQPHKLFVLADDTEVGLGEARQRGDRVHGELDPILFAEGVRDVHFLFAQRDDFVYNMDI